MGQRPFKAKAYIREGCPYSFKYLVFMAEAGLMNEIEVIRCKPGTREFDAVKARLAAGLGGKATFPTVEIEPGRYQSDSDALIACYAARHGVDAGKLPVLSFYEETILPQLLELHPPAS